MIQVDGLSQAIRDSLPGCGSLGQPLQRRLRLPGQPGLRGTLRQSRQQPPRRGRAGALQHLDAPERTQHLAGRDRFLQLFLNLLQSA
jgi:hypothetical protein